MTKREIRKKAEAKIKEGKSRQEVFDELVTEVSEPQQKIAKIVRYRITLSARKKFSNLFYIFIGGVILSILLKLLGGIYLISLINPDSPLFYLFALLVPIVSVILLIQALNYNGAAFSGIAAVNAYAVFNTVKNLDKIQFDIWMGIELGFILGLIGLAIYLNLNVVPNYEMKTKYKNPETGKIESKESYYFKDVEVSNNNDDDIVI